LGHRRIAYLCAEPPNQSYQERVRAYREFMAAIGESADRFLVPPCPIGHIDGIGRDKEAGYQQTVQFLKGQERATAFVCANDEIAFGCYKACFDNGLRIPEDISVAGCDDQSFAKYLSPGLTTIRLPLISRGKRAIHCLSDYLRGKQSGLPREYLLPELVIRSSVAAPPDA
ncbi:MAG: LacI family DNA-binding transcriptional regulator, partial [Victivallis vadensis]